MKRPNFTESSHTDYSQRCCITIQVPLHVGTYVCSYICMQVPMYYGTYVCSYLCVQVPMSVGKYVCRTLWMWVPMYVGKRVHMITASIKSSLYIVDFGTVQTTFLSLYLVPAFHSLPSFPYLFLFIASHFYLIESRSSRPLLYVTGREG